jgi:hypothetical protein
MDKISPTNNIQPLHTYGQNSELNNIEVLKFYYISLPEDILKKLFVGISLAGMSCGNIGFNPTYRKMQKLLGEKWANLRMKVG